MKMDSKTWERSSIHSQDLALRLISAVHDRPAIWMDRDKSFRNTFAKNNAWLAVSLEVGESVEVIKKKWRNLTIQYHNNRKAYFANLEAGSGSSETEKPTWYAYEAMQFLEQLNKHRRTIKNTATVEQIDESLESIADGNAHGDCSPSKTEVVLLEPETLQSAIPTAKRNIPEGPGRSTKKSRTESYSDRITDALSVLNSSVQSVTGLVKQRNQCAGIGEYIADTLLELKDGSNVDLCADIFALCANARNNERSAVIKSLTKRLEKYSDEDFYQITNHIQEYLEHIDGELEKPSKQEAE